MTPETFSLIAAETCGNRLLYFSIFCRSNLEIIKSVILNDQKENGFVCVNYKLIGFYLIHQFQSLGFVTLALSMSTIIWGGRISATTS